MTIHVHRTDGSSNRPKGGERKVLPWLSSRPNQAQVHKVLDVQLLIPVDVAK